MWSPPASLDLRGVALPRFRTSTAARLDSGPGAARRSGSVLGVGHFTVPPDVTVESPASNGDVTETWSTIRTLVVPHGIAAVPRRSPIKLRKRTPWHPAAEAPGVVERAGGRDWFTDRLFVEAKQANLMAACSTSAIVHVVVAILLLSLLAAGASRANVMARPHMAVSLRMPAMMSPMPAVAPPPARKPFEPPSLALDPPRPTPSPARVIEAAAAAPVETPSAVEAEPTALDAAPGDAAAGAEVDGATDGVSGRVAGGIGNGSAVEAAPTQLATGVFRVGDDIARPRKIKDAKPVYPLPAMAAQVSGSVLIEATIGADGKVHNARVLRSVAVLDQAALDAVRQWEYEPSRLNGVAVSVTMVIVVTFALL